ncbi:MAG: hypothetical protein ACRDTG_06160 [Pseudonocardiaceae bacterium]
MAGVMLPLSVPLLMVTTAPDALACSCATIGFPSQIERADVVFTGQAIERDEAVGILAGSGDPVTWTFAVDRLHKGAAQDEQEVVSARSEATCGIEFEVGTTYLVFASGQSSDDADSMATGLCDGTRRLSEVSANDMKALGVIESPRGVTEPAAEADRWVPLLVAGLGAVIVGGFLSVVALRRWRNRSSGG